MPFKFFRPRRSSTPKGKTIKKADPLGDRQARSDFYDEDEDHDRSIVDLSKVEDWVKESAAESLEAPKYGERAVLKEVKGPRHANLVNEGATHSNLVNGQQAINEHCGQRATSQTDDGPEPDLIPMVDVLLGHQDPSSQYFSCKYFCVPARTLAFVQSEGNFPLPIANLDPHAFELYQIWLHTGVIPTQQRVMCFYHPASDVKKTWQSCWPLINAHILGVTLNAPNFTDRVVDMLQAKLSGDIFPDIDTLKHIFSSSGNGISEALRRFVVDRCLEGGKEKIANMNMSSLPPNFVISMLEEVMRRLPSNLLKEHATPGCEYHTHKPAEECYKNMILPKESLKEERLAYQRSRSRKDAEKVIANAQANGVKIVDWAEQRAEGNRNLLEQTGRRHVRFSRLMRSGPESTQPYNGTGESNGQAPEVQARLVTSTQDLFGTAQTNGAVDDVLGELPRYSSSNAAHVELPAAAACTEALGCSASGSNR